ncbi:MAG TPA: hypothetical protein VFA26_00985, partial [Gemmataceae bacterium]|nr:hypothetical protein [Gemmataceae bacterium]
MALLRNRRYLVMLLAALLVGGGSAAWLGRDSLRTWYYLRSLERADEASRDAWAGRVAGLGSAAVPAAVSRLANPEPQACDNLRAALARLAEPWPAEDPRRAELGGRLIDGFASFSPAGQRAALRLAADWLKPASADRRPPAPAVQLAARLLTEASRSEDCDVRSAALDLAAALLDGGDWTGLLGPCRDLARACLRDDRPENRTRAVRLALHPGMDLAEQVFPLLQDPATEVRRAAMLVAGAAQNVISTEKL